MSLPLGAWIFDLLEVHPFHLARTARPSVGFATDKNRERERERERGRERERQRDRE